MEHSVENLICMERSQPEKRLVLSDGALLALVLFGVIGAVLLSYDLAARFDLPRAWVQLALYGGLCVLGYRIYRTRLLGFRYTLTDRRIQIDRLVGNKARPEAEFLLEDLLEVRPARSGEKGCQKLYAAGQSERLYIKYRSEVGEKALVLSPSDGFLKELEAKWQTSQN